MKFGFCFFLCPEFYIIKYQASDLYDCDNLLHHLCCNDSDSNLAAIREKWPRSIVVHQLEAHILMYVVLC